MIVWLPNEHHFEFLSLKGGCTGSSESSHVKMPHCWKSHVAAHMIFFLSGTISIGHGMTVSRQSSLMIVPEAFFSQMMKLI